MLQCYTLEKVGEKLNGHHAEGEEPSGTIRVESIGESTGDESDDCWIHMLEYNPPRWISSSWVPCSTTTPSLKTRIKSKMMHEMRDLF